MVFVLDRSKKPLDMISHAKARILLKNRLAVVHKVYPFTIRLKDNSCVSNNRTYTVKLDPGSRTTGVATEIDHIIPRSNGGTNSSYNLTPACRPCNEKKSNLSLKEFGKLMNKDYSQLEPKKLPKDAAIVQSARNYMIKEITKLVSNTTSYDAWLTKYNRDRLDLSKQHYYDALSVGNIENFRFLTDKVLQISAKGRGSRQMCRMDKFGFPRTKPKGSKLVKGFQTGDMVKAIVPKGLKKGEYLGKVAVRSSGYFNIQTKTQVIQDIGYKYCRLIQRSDGYSYNYKECDFLSAIHNRVSIADFR